MGLNVSTIIGIGSGTVSVSGTSTGGVFVGVGVGLGYGMTAGAQGIAHGRNLAMDSILLTVVSHISLKTELGIWFIQDG